MATKKVSNKAVQFPKRLTVSVTADDIRLGKRNDVCKCPIARALKRVVKLPVSVGNPDVEIYPKGEGVEDGPIAAYRLSAKGSKFINRFDDTGKATPQTVTLFRDAQFV